MTDFKLGLRSEIESTRNLLNTYEPNRTPSAIASRDEIFLAGSEIVALELPQRARAAAPAARLSTSSSSAGLCSPSPVKTSRRVVIPGTLITSSVFPVAPISAKIGSNFFVSSAISPLSITRFTLPSRIDFL